MTFEEYLDERLGELLRFATVLCGERGLGEDVVQEVLIRAHARWAKISRAGSPHAYVRAMIVNEYLGWRRKWARIIPVGSVDERRHRPDHADQVADRAQLRQLLEALPRRQRAAVVLRFYAGLSDAEIARTFGCSAGTVRGYLSRVMATLRVRLAGDPVLAGRDR